MAVSNVALFGSSFLTPVIVGKITRELGWQWTFYLVAIFSGVCLPFVFLFVPETAYRRAAYLDTDMKGKELDHEKQSGEGTFEMAHSSNGTTTELASYSPTTSGKDHDQESAHMLHQPHPQEPIPPKVSFAKSLMPFNGRKTDENFLKLLIRPFPLFFHFGILWVIERSPLSS
jgi:MFS family permease